MRLNVNGWGELNHFRSGVVCRIIHINSNKTTPNDFDIAATVVGLR